MHDSREFLVLRCGGISLLIPRSLFCKKNQVDSLTVKIATRSLLTCIPGLAVAIAFPVREMENEKPRIFLNFPVRTGKNREVNNLCTALN